eukprot:GHVT01053355.1.p2 GENE.GHVT01053355.1~~GHVT01053355.1.p2  ORF type:complete len:405 (+),score=71.11 GHVT01053355.1:1922-3136(+)
MADSRWLNSNHSNEPVEGNDKTQPAATPATTGSRTGKKSEQVELDIVHTSIKKFCLTDCQLNHEWKRKSAEAIEGLLKSLFKVGKFPSGSPRGALFSRGLARLAGAAAVCCSHTLTPELLGSCVEFLFATIQRHPPQPMATEPRRGLEPAATACPKGAAAAGESKARAEDSETHSTQAPDSNRFANNSKANHSCLCATLDPPNSSFGSPMFWEELFTADGTDALEQPTDSNRKQIDIAEHTTGKTYTCTTSSALSSSSSSLSSSCSFSLSSSSFSCSVDCISIVRRCPSCISCLSLRRLFRFDLPVLWPPSVSSIWERHLRELLNALAFRPTAGKENVSRSSSSRRLADQILDCNSCPSDTEEQLFTNRTDYYPPTSSNWRGIERGPLVVVEKNQLAELRRAAF